MHFNTTLVLGVPVGLFPVDFPTKFTYTSPPTPIILLHLMSLIILGYQRIQVSRSHFAIYKHSVLSITFNKVYDLS